MTMTIILILVLAAVLAYLIDRDLRRADELRRRREWLRENPEFERMRASLIHLRIEVQDAFTPAMVRLGKALAEMGEKLQGGAGR
jgi:hypothetical protein